MGRIAIVTGGTRGIGAVIARRLKASGRTVAGVPKEVLEGIVAQIPVGRLGQTDEIARIVEFLVGDEAAFITGSTMTANGGQYMA
jgi:NAD(P)-dependent dehydrogenase (short-subunit alcohol dehydrogenase family)